MVSFLFQLLWIIAKEREPNVKMLFLLDPIFMGKVLSF